MSTNYTHLDQIAFDKLFGYGSDGKEIQLLDAAGNFTPTSVTLQSLTADPTSPSNGDMWYNTTLGKLRTKQAGNILNFDRDIKNVKDFGAKGDGTTDDTTAINNALAGGGFIFLPAATYKITAQLNVASNSVIFGAGSGTILTCSGTVLGSTTLYPYFNLSNVSNVNISKIKINGNGIWTSTPFASPYGVGNCLGFQNQNIGIYFNPSSSNVSNIVITECEITGVDRAIQSLVSAANSVTNVIIANNYFHIHGTAAVSFQKGANFSFSNNVIVNVAGNQTDPGDTTLNNSKFADGFYLKNTTDGVVSNNYITTIVRIGIVLESNGSIVDTRISIGDNTIVNCNGARGTEANAGIWCEPTHATSPVSITGNTINNSDSFGIVGYLCNIVGGNIFNCNSGAISGEGILVSGVDIENNQYGIYLNNFSNILNSVITVQNCMFRSNKVCGIFYDRGVDANWTAAYIQGNTFIDNGSNAGSNLGANSAICVYRYYNNQTVVIKDNTFISSAADAATSGQLYAIRATTGGDVNYSTEYVTSNDFLFTGTLAAYPTNLSHLPTAFGYDNGSTVAIREITNTWGNYNSKLAAISVDDQSSAQTAGFPQFLGYTNAAPGSGAYKAGDFYANNAVSSTKGLYFVCTAAGSPGTWTTFGAAATTAGKTLKGNSTSSSALVSDLSVSTVNTLLGTVTQDGTKPLTANWSAGAFSITANSVKVGSAANTVSGLNTINGRAGTGLTISSSTSAVTLQGTNTNNTQASGKVGEIVTAIVSTATNCAASNAYTDATSISLTAGAWDVTGTVSFRANGATFNGGLEAGISTTTGNSAAGLVDSQNYVFSASVPNSSENLSLTVPTYRVNISSTTIHYLKALALYSAGTPQFKCFMRATRVF